MQTVSRLEPASCGAFTLDTRRSGHTQGCPLLATRNARVAGALRTEGININSLCAPLTSCHRMPGKSIQWSVPRQKHARSCCRSLPAAQSRTCLLLPARPRVSSHLIWVTSPKTPGRSPGMHIASEQWALASLHDLIVAALRACVCVCVCVPLQVSLSR